MNVHTCTCMYGFTHVYMYLYVHPFMYAWFYPTFLSPSEKMIKKTNKQSIRIKRAEKHPFYPHFIIFCISRSSYKSLYRYQNAIIIITINSPFVHHRHSSKHMVRSILPFIRAEPIAQKRIKWKRRIKGSFDRERGKTLFGRGICKYISEFATYIPLS